MSTVFHSIFSMAVPVTRMITRLFHPGNAGLNAPIVIEMLERLLKHTEEDRRKTARHSGFEFFRLAESLTQGSQLWL